MFQGKDMYDPDSMINKSNDMKLLLDQRVDTQVILQLLVEKGIVTREEVSEKRDYIKQQPMYKKAYEVINNTANLGQYYKDNPEDHLKDILDAKMRGRC